MLRAKLVSGTDGPDEPAPHRERRRYYRITDVGQRAMRAELRRLERAMAVARRKHLTPLKAPVSL